MSDQPSSAVNTPRRRLLAAAAATVATTAFGSARAEQFPARTIKLVCPFPAGGSADAVSRLIAQALTAELGQTVVVENKAGAGGNIAADMVARSPADGYTLLVAGQAIMAINQALYKKLPYDPEKDFRFVSMIASMPNVLITNPQALPARNVKELVAQAKAKPGHVSYGSNGIGSLAHLTTALMANAAGLDLLHVPYRGASPIMVDLLAGRLGFCFTGSAQAVQMVQEGKVRALAVTSGSRISALPDVPTLVESGFPEMDVAPWFAVVAPSGVPAPVYDRLQKACAKVTESKQYGAELDRLSSIALTVSPQAGEALLKRERTLWAGAVKTTGASAD